MKSFFFSAVILLQLMLISAQATIHYTYIGETVYSSTPLFIDIDLDGDNDFHFTAVDIGPSTGSIRSYVNCTKTTSQYAAEGTTDTLPKAYSEGAGLGTHHWQNTPGLLASPTIGYFRNTTKFLMVKFSDANNNTYYGWFHLHHSGWYVTVESYAYSDVPDEVIKAGEMEPTGISDLASSSFHLAKLSRRSIAFQDCGQFDRVSIFSIEGRQLAEINRPVAYNDYPVENAGGMVLVVFQKNGKPLHTQKYFIKPEE